MDRDLRNVLILIATTAAVCAGRMLVPGHGLTWAGSYEAAAHIWVGWVAAVVYFRWKTGEGRIAFLLLIAASLLELFMFLARLYGNRS